MAKAKKEEQSQNVKDIIERLNKTYGLNTVLTFNAATLNDKYDVISSGSIGIDYKVLGVGGVAKGKVYMIKGWQGSNKTTFCGHLAANCQKNGGTVVFIDGERAIDKTYMGQLGVVFDDTFILVQPDYGEAGFDMAIKLMESGKVDLVIIDSDTSLLPKAIMEGEVGQMTIGKKAKLNSETYPKIKVASSKYNVAVVSIAQYRVNPGQMFGDNRVVPGGHAQEYISDVVMDFTKKLKKEGDETSGTITTLKSTKNKLHVPYISYEFNTVFGYGIDKFQEIIELGKEYDILQERADVVKFRGNKYSGADFRVMLQDNDDFFNELKEDIVTKIKAGKVEVGVPKEILQKELTNELVNELILEDNEGEV